MVRKFMKNPKFESVGLPGEIIDDDRILEGDKYAPFVATGQLIEVTPEMEKKVEVKVSEPKDEESKELATKKKSKKGQVKEG